MRESPIIKIAPSIICADHSRLEQQLGLLQEASADLLHVDVMDGHFVETFGLSQVDIQVLRAKTPIPIEAHLAIERPERHIDLFADGGATIITVHVEACPHLLSAIQKVKARGIGAAVALNPATPVEAIQHILREVDMVQVMLVNPGYRQQPLFVEALAKVRWLRQKTIRENLRIDIGVDGGIREDTIRVAAAAGANVFVVGGAVFDRERDFDQSIRLLRELAVAGYRESAVPMDSC